MTVPAAVGLPAATANCTDAPSHMELGKSFRPSVVYSLAIVGLIRTHVQPAMSIAPAARAARAVTLLTSTALSGLSMPSSSSTKEDASAGGAVIRQMVATPARNFPGAGG